MVDGHHAYQCQLENTLLQPLDLDHLLLEVPALQEFPVPVLLELPMLVEPPLLLVPSMSLQAPQQTLQWMVMQFQLHLRQHLQLQIDRWLTSSA